MNFVLPVHAKGMKTVYKGVIHVGRKIGFISIRKKNDHTSNGT
jgi:hypothetical protein